MCYIQLTILFGCLLSILKSGRFCELWCVCRFGQFACAYRSAKWQSNKLWICLLHLHNSVLDCGILYSRILCECFVCHWEWFLSTCPNVFAMTCVRGICGVVGLLFLLCCDSPFCFSHGCEDCLRYGLSVVICLLLMWLATLWSAVDLRHRVLSSFFVHIVIESVEISLLFHCLWLNYQFKSKSRHNHMAT